MRINGLMLIKKMRRKIQLLRSYLLIGRIVRLYDTG
jgi:hypothetical protein